MEGFILKHLTCQIAYSLSIYSNVPFFTSVSHTNSSLSNESFTYDANGNETGTGYTTTTGNEQTASPGYTYTYEESRHP